MTSPIPVQYGDIGPSNAPIVDSRHETDYALERDAGIADLARHGSWVSALAKGIVQRQRSGGPTISHNKYIKDTTWRREVPSHGGAVQSVDTVSTHSRVSAHRVPEEKSGELHLNGPRPDSEQSNVHERTGESLLKSLHSACTDLPLAYIGLGPRYGSLLAQGIRETCPHLRTLDLSHNPVGDLVGQQLAISLRDHPQLQILKLSNCGFSDESMDGITAMIAVNSALKVVDLSHNSLTDNSGLLFRDAIIDSTTLQTLDLSHTHIALHTLSCLAEALYYNTSMRVLHFSGCTRIVSDHPLRGVILSMLEVNGFLDGHRHPQMFVRGTSQQSALALCIKFNTSRQAFKQAIQRQYISAVHLSLELCGLYEVPDSLRGNDVVHVLYLDNNRITEVPVWLFRELPVLRRVNLSRNPFRTLPAFAGVRCLQGGIDGMYNINNEFTLIIDGCNLQDIPSTWKLNKRDLSARSLGSLDRKVVDLEELWAFLQFKYQHLGDEDTPNVYDDKGLTLMHKAVVQGRPMRELDNLMTLGGRINMGCRHLGNTPMHYAVLGGLTEYAAKLVAMGANVCAPNLRNETPILYAVMKDIDPKGSLLPVSISFSFHDHDQQRGPGISARGDNQVVFGTTKGKATGKSLVRTLLKSVPHGSSGGYSKGLLATLPYSQRHQMVSLAIIQRALPSLRQLLLAGAGGLTADDEVMCVTSSTEYIPYSHYCASHGNEHALSLLHITGVPLDRVDRKGNTHVHIAAERNQVSYLRYIIEHKLIHECPIDARNGSSETALHVAAAWGHDDFVMLLLDAGADRELVNGAGQTPLTVAVENGEVSTVDILLCYTP